MRTKNDFSHLNYNEYAFFKGVSVSEAKWDFASHIYEAEDIEDNCTLSGIPKIKLSDRLQSSLFNFKIHSNSRLDGECQLSYLCDFYNKEIPLNTLREFSQSKPFEKALKFTGKNSVLNELLNKSQYRKLQETWLFSNCYCKNTYSDQTVDFINNYNWSIDFLFDKGISNKSVERQIEKYEQRKNPKPEVETIFN